jgi:hypothetical protein
LTKGARCGIITHASGNGSQGNREAARGKQRAMGWKRDREPRPKKLLKKVLKNLLTNGTESDIIDRLSARQQIKKRDGSRETEAGWIIDN